MKYKYIYLQLFLLCCVNVMQAADAYRIKNIASANTETSLATGINQNGQVCGIVKMNDRSASSVFVWDSEKGLQTVEVSSMTSPSINQKGQIVGTLEEKGWFWNSFRGFVWDPQNGMSYVKNPAWSSTIVRGITDDEKVLVMNHFANLSKSNPKAKFAVFQNGQFLNNPLSEIQQIDKANNNSQALGLGFYHMGSDEIAYPVIVDLMTNTFTALPLVGSAYGYDLNDAGQVVGQFYDSSQKEWKGFLWDPQEGLIVYDTFFPHAINNLGQIVGFDAEQNPTLFENGELKNLNLIATSEAGDSMPWKGLIRATGINDQGKIIGWGMIGSEIQAFVLEPIDQVESGVEISGLDTAINVNDSNFTMVLEEGVYLVDFYADWCGHCTKMLGVIDEFAKLTKGQLIVAKANIDTTRKNATNFHVSGIPTLILFKNGQEVKRINGYKDLPTLIQLVGDEL